MTQLDLFDWQPPAARILAFPPRRMLGAIRLSAEAVIAAGRRERRVLDTKVFVLEFRLQRLGFSDESARRIAAPYRQAIIAEVARLRAARRKPSDAA